mmetsp:Transcript_86186/g.257260  ORF Transcript_86186/g.257260 Transcript_86186/m.257260 type:complete len:255 (-) Transcript_86186:246-1010(-)
MVLVEELIEEEEAPAPVQPPAESSSKGSAALNRGFLNETKESLYGPEGSPEGRVAPETHKAHAEHKMNEDINAGMNKGAKNNNGFERPPWYTKEWPKDCQYNSPGCDLQEMERSGHATELHKDMVRNGERWREALAPGTTAMRLSFMSLTDEDLEEVIKRLKGNQDLTELDLSHNKIKDVGVQALVASLAGGGAPNLRELRLYSNEFGELGQTMLTQGLSVFRKKLEVHWKEPSWARLTRPQGAEAVAAAPAAA